MMRTLKTILLLAILCCSFGLRAEKQPKMQTVYVFGISASFTDSVAFLTDVMRVDSAYILPNGFLFDRTLYSLQLENYVLGTCHVENSTNAIFFSTRKKDIDKKYDKVNRMYQRSENLALIYVGEDEFRFAHQSYEQPELLDQNGEAIKVEEKSEKKNKKKGKK